MEKLLNYIKNNTKETLIVCSITFIALILRIIVLQNYGDLWLDELYSYYFAAQKTMTGTVFELLKQDIHMPIYFMILHLWIKIFGKTDVSLHLCTLFITLPLIPIAFYTMKKLFNPMVGYFSSLFFALNTFCIYYSVEVRFYGLVFVLSLLTAYYFTKMIDRFEKKDILCYILWQTILLYTFTSTSFLILSYAIFTAIYVLKFRQEFFNKALETFCILLTLAIPYILIMIYNIMYLSTNICNFAIDIYPFNWNVLTDIVENFYTSYNFQLITMKTNLYNNFFLSLFEIKYLFFVAIPVIIGVLGLIKSLTTKSLKINAFLIPSLVWFVLNLILSSNHMTVFITRYTSIIFPIIICASIYGLLTFKKQVVAISLFSTILIINSIYLFIFPISVFNNNKYSLRELPKILIENINIQKNDYIICPYSGSKIAFRYIPRGRLIPIDVDDMLLLKARKYKHQTLAKEHDINVNYKNAKDKLYGYTQPYTTLAFYYSYLDLQLKNKTDNDKIIFISYRNSFTQYIVTNWHRLEDKDIYNTVSTFTFMMSKYLIETQKYLNDRYKLLNTYTNENGDYIIYVYTKNK